FPLFLFLLPLAGYGPSRKVASGCCVSFPGIIAERRFLCFPKTKLQFQVEGGRLLPLFRGIFLEMPWCIKPHRQYFLAIDCHKLLLGNLFSAESLRSILEHISH